MATMLVLLAHTLHSDKNCHLLTTSPSTMGTWKKELSDEGEVFDPRKAHNI